MVLIWGHGTGWALINAIPAGVAAVCTAIQVCLESLFETPASLQNPSKLKTYVAQPARLVAVCSLIYLLVLNALAASENVPWGNLFGYTLAYSLLV
jgi:hypothetical protein